MNLYEWGCSIPWCITDEALTAMLAIAAREEISADDLKQVMHGPKSLALRDGQRREDSATMQTLDGVARIVIDGPIYRYADYFTKYSGGITTEALARDFQKALDDPAVGAIALIVDSPGGEATGINELADTIFAARGRKPIGAYVEGLGASAAYWIASAADFVTVDESALIGSIGTVLGVPDPTKRTRYTIDFVSSQSPKKRVDPTQDDGRAYLQSLVDDMTEVFIAKVMRNRSITRQQVLAVEGGMRVGAAAVTSGLADRIGSEDMLIRELATKAAQRAPFSTPPARVPGGNPLRMEDSMNWKDFWKGMFDSAAEASAEAPSGDALLSAPRTAQLSVTAEQIAAAVQPAQTGPDPREERIRALEKQLADQQEQQIQTAAAAWADAAIRGNQALPAERAQLVSLHAQAARDDAKDSGQRVAQLTGLIAQRPAHSLTVESVQVGQGGVLESGAETGMTAERRAQLMGYTPLGQSIIKRTPAA